MSHARNSPEPDLFIGRSLAMAHDGQSQTGRGTAGSHVGWGVSRLSSDRALMDAIHVATALLRPLWPYPVRTLRTHRQHNSNVHTRRILVLSLRMHGSRR